MFKNVLLISSIIGSSFGLYGQAGTCASPIQLTCGQTVTGNTSNYANNIENYTCAFSLKEGKEIVYIINVGASTTLNAALTNVTQGKNLKLALLNTCSGTDCLDMSDDDPFSNNESANFSVTANNTYYLIVDGNDAKDTAAFTLAVTCSQTTAIAETKIENISLYPNPATNVLNVSGVDLKQANTRVFDLTGKNVLNEVTFTQNSIDLSNLNKGVYFLSVEVNNKRLTKKFTIN